MPLIRTTGLIALMVAACVPLAGCGVMDGSHEPGRYMGVDMVVGLPPFIPSGIAQQPVPTSQPLPPIGDSCSGAGRICLALKYVSYVDPRSESAVMDRDGAIANVRALNQLWSQCGVAFQMERYETVRPSEHGLRFTTRDIEELDQIREEFADNAELLVVTTGTWDRDGTLGDSAANAWTTMPGGGPHGVVLEEPVGGFSNLIGHELGHYMSLLHVRDDHALMNPIIYSNSMNLSAEQCSIVRSAAAFFWPRMYR
jgi:hypothetical protein